MGSLPDWVSPARRPRCSEYEISEAAATVNSHAIVIAALVNLVVALAVE